MLQVIVINYVTDDSISCKLSQTGIKCVYKRSLRNTRTNCMSYSSNKKEKKKKKILLFIYLLIFVNIYCNIINIQINNDITFVGLVMESLCFT